MLRFRLSGFCVFQMQVELEMFQRERKSRTMTNPSYFDRYENLAFSRDGNGVLTMRFHTNGRPITFTGQTHEDLPFALEEIAADEDNRAMILTGTDDVFMDQIDGPSLGDLTKPVQFERTPFARNQDPRTVPVIAVPSRRRSQWTRHCAFRVPPLDRHPHRVRASHVRRPAAPNFRDRGRRRPPGRLGGGGRYGADQMAALERREHRRCYRHAVGCCRGGPAP